MFFISIRSPSQSNGTAPAMRLSSGGPHVVLNVHLESLSSASPSLDDRAEWAALKVPQALHIHEQSYKVECILLSHSVMMSSMESC